MTRPTLVNGDVWTETLANAAIRPTIDGLDNPGSADLVTDAQLSQNPDQLLARFNSFHNRVKLTSVSGLILSYAEYSVVVSNGNRIVKSASNIVLSNNTTQFVYLDTSGNMVAGSTLPDNCEPIASVTTLSGAVTALVDLRHQTNEHITPFRVPEAVSPFAPGDVKPTFSSATQPGWLPCDGATLLVADYPALFNAIGYTHGGSGLNFKVPDLRGRFVLAESGSYVLGANGGSATTRLSVNELPSHSHGVIDNGHNHAISDPGHVHGINDSGHNHSINDPGHFHRLRDVKQAALNAQDNDGAGAELSSQGTGNTPPTDEKTTGITVLNRVTGISLRSAASGVSSVPSFASVSVSANGGGAEFSNMPPYIVCKYLIKT